MGKKNKLKKFGDLLSYSNVYENYDPKYPKLLLAEGVEADMKGKWSSHHFENSNPIILELACGRGEYTVALAKAYPDQNFIGIDVKGARMWQGATQALEQNLNNAAFLRTRIEQIALFFAAAEVDGIWITFPDPFLRESKEMKRLTSSRFLDQYQKIIKKGATLHLKTDDPTLYDFTLETLNEYEGAHILYSNDDIYKSALDYPELEYKTHYEREHLADGRKIKYIRFTIN
jgi:tRNA (guanine-N7-)-methyltransferase